MLRTLCWLCTSSTTNNQKIDGGCSYGGILKKSQDVEEEDLELPRRFLSKLQRSKARKVTGWRCQRSKESLFLASSNGADCSCHISCVWVSL